MDTQKIPQKFTQNVHYSVKNSVLCFHHVSLMSDISFDSLSKN